MTTLLQCLVKHLKKTLKWEIPIISSMFRSKLPHWSNENISDQWFKDHFEGAAPIIHEWLNAELEMPGACLLDFGCGDGITDLAIALKYRPKNVIGVDITSTFTNLDEIAARQIGLKGLPENLSFQKIAPGQSLVHILKVDAIFTWSTFEHIERLHLDTVVGDLFDLLPQGGVFFLQIEPLYYSPFGSHLGRFIKQPWAHLLLDEETLKRTVLEYSDDIPANEKEYNFYVRTFEEYKAFIYGEFLKLNKLTAGEIVDLFYSQGFKEIRKESYKVALPVPDILMTKYPKEDLLTNEIRLLLQKP